MIDKLRHVLGDLVKENEPLKNHTTFKIGGPARYFFVAESEEEIIKAVAAAKDLNLSYFILGGGSNVLVSDDGFDGLIIKITDYRLQITDFEIEAGAGVLLQVLVQESAKAGLSGLEQAAGIPGTLGGAIFGNAGGRYWGMGDVLKSVKLLYPDGKIETVSRDWMEFGYRESKLKNFPMSGRPIILSAILELKSGNPEEIKKIMVEKTAGREQKLPKEPSAGCVFKNLENQSVGQIIDSLGLKEKCAGNACVSNLHANFIVNKGNATAKDVRELIELIKKTVKEKKGIELAEEIQYLGF